MALEKQVVYKGVNCDYWKIYSKDVYYDTPVINESKYTKMRVVVALYVDRASREADVSHWLRLKGFTFLQDGPSSPTSTDRAAVYAALKLLPEFEGANDD